MPKDFVNGMARQDLLRRANYDPKNFTLQIINTFIYVLCIYQLEYNYKLYDH